MRQTHKISVALLERDNPTSNGHSALFSDCTLMSDYLFLLDLKLFPFFNHFTRHFETRSGGGEVLSNGLIKDYGLDQF